MKSPVTTSTIHAAAGASRQRAPPTLACTEDIGHRDERQRGGIEQSWPCACGTRACSARRRPTQSLRCHHGSCGLNTMAMIIPVSTAPLGDSTRAAGIAGMTASISAATPIALARTPDVWLMPSIGNAIASRITKTIVSRPFGVLKNRIVTRKASGRVPLQRWRHQQPFDAVTLQQSNPLVRTERERRGRKAHRRASRSAPRR